MKLKYGTSIPEFEDHIKNATKLIDGNVPVKWSKVVKNWVMKRQALPGLCNTNPFISYLKN